MENDLIKIAFTVALTTIGGMVTWYLRNIASKFDAVIKELREDIKKVKEEQAEITYNYVTKFGEVRKDIYDLGASFSNYTDKISNHFEDKLNEIKEMFEKHFLEKHGGIVEDVAALKKRLAIVEKELMENFRHMNEKATEFYQKYQSALDWIEEKRKEEREQLRMVKRRGKINVQS